MNFNNNDNSSLWSTTRPPAGANNGQYTSIYQADPFLSTESSYPPSDPKHAAFSGARSYAGSDSRQSYSGDVKPSFPVTSGQTRHRARRWTFSLKVWSWELATWILGSAAFAVIIVLLITYKDDRFDSWHSDIQITTIIAALSQLAQSALLVSLAACLGQLKWTWLRDERSAADLQLFDEASRGPWGSLQLIGLGILPSRTVRRNGFGFPKLAVLGALAVCLMLAFSTFAQQSVAIVLRDYVIEGAAPGLNRTLRYSQEATTLGQSASAEADLFMSDGVTAGLLTRQNTLSDVIGDCASERCDWAPYWTLAVCPIVEDLSSKIVSLEQGTVEGVPMKVENLTSTSIVLSLGVASDPLYVQPLDAPTSNITIEQRGIISDSLFMAYSSCAVEGLGYSKNRNNTDKYWSAYRSTFHLCLQRLNSTFYNSSMHTEVLESRTDVAWVANPINGSAGFDICGDSPDGTHCLREDFLRSAAFKLKDTFTGNASTFPGGDDEYHPERTRTFAQDLLGPVPSACSNDTTIGYPKLESRMQNVASSMSNTMRLAPSADRIFGTATTTSQFIQVNFAWLAYPAALWLMSTIFLIGTIYHSRNSGAPLWKSSSLALLTSRDPHNDLRSEQEVSQALRNTGMQLQDTGSGWQLVQNREMPVR